MSWTDERVELLKKLWADGLSASQIAGELGGITRNAVIGKVHRLGLSGRAKSPSSSAPRARKPRSAHDAGVAALDARQHRARACLRVWNHEPEPELIENIIPIGQRRTLLELNEDTCRWPIGDPATPGFFFCGGKPLTALPYCGYHSRVAYQPANERRRDRGRRSGRADTVAPIIAGHSRRRANRNRRRFCTSHALRDRAAMRHGTSAGAELGQAAERPKRSSSA